MKDKIIKKGSKTVLCLDVSENGRDTMKLFINLLEREGYISLDRFEDYDWKMDDIVIHKNIHLIIEFIES